MEKLVTYYVKFNFVKASSQEKQLTVGIRVKPGTDENSIKTEALNKCKKEHPIYFKANSWKLLEFAILH
jgi:hypothetical protein